MKAALAYAQRDLETLRLALPMVRARDACIQAGACLGVFPEWLSDQFASVYSFEPDSALFRKAVLRCTRGNVHLFNAALGYTRGMVRTECRRRDSSTRPAHEGLTFVTPDPEFGTVPVLRIDDLQLPSVDLIQLDLEGYEQEALAGAVHTLERCRPVLVVEVNKQAPHGEEHLRRYVRSLGYRMTLASHSDEVYLPC